MKKKFIYFPFKKKPCILYENKTVLKTRIFRTFYRKLLSNSYSSRLQKSEIFLLYNKFFGTVKIDVPPEVNLIYQGHDRQIYFSIKNEKIKKVYYKENNKLKQKEFLGYPLYITHAETFINNYPLLKKFLKQHWSDLKQNKTKLHGDLTHFNILVNNKKINLIDEQKNVKSSIITDHFYFYTYLLEYIDVQKPYNKELKYFVIKEMSKLYQELFKNINIEQEIKKINMNHIHLKNKKSGVQRFKEIFL